jgi:subtilisin family serine protease
MPRPRILSIFCIAVVVIVGLFAVSGRGQTPASPRRLLSRIAPPAIERGIAPDFSHAPGTPEMRRRQSLRVVGGVVDRRGVSGTPYRPGRLIVKFSDGVSAAERVSALSVVAGGATMSPRAAGQDFDVIEIDPAADPEAAARGLRARPDVEYAQAAYRARAEFVPNDRLYSMQWNLPDIGMETAWDIQPTAGSAITVAVIDTGVAYTPATVQFRASAFTLDSNQNVGPPGSGGTAYPSLGNLSLQFVAATELQPLTRFVAPYDFIWNDALPLDLDGHGTHVSGTIGQLTNNAANGLGDVAHGGGTAGIAFNVKLMPVKVIDSQWDDIFGSPNVGTDTRPTMVPRFSI